MKPHDFRSQFRDWPYGQTRRQAVKASAAAGAVAWLGGVPAGASTIDGDTPAGEFTNPIVEENKLPGTTAWQLTRVWVNEGSYRTSLIEGYCSHQSVAAGEVLHLFVSTKPARKYTLDIYRMGYYGGAGGCHKLTLGPLQGTTQPVPEMGPAPRRLRECRWEPAVTLQIPPEWTSGVYLGKLTTIPLSRHEPYWQSYVIFIVRDARPADLLFQCSDNTWQAYNRWPVNESLYTHPDGAHAPEVAVSFDRPYGKYVQILDHPLSVGSGEFLLWEFPLCYWLEQHGYDVTYGANRDSCHTSFLQRCKAFLSVGHDEYWDARQYAAVRQAMEAGMSLVWLCGNSVFIDSPFEPSADGRPDRIIWRRGCYGELRKDELDSYASLFAGLQSTAPDERTIMGVRSVVPFNGGGDWTCRAPDHWIFAGTGMQRDESIPGLVGWEHQGEPDRQLPDMQVVAAGPVWTNGTREGRYEAVAFRGPRGNVVFNAATVYWAQGLASPPGHVLPWSHYTRPHGPDPRVQQITHNVLRRAIETATTPSPSTVPAR